MNHRNYFFGERDEINMNELCANFGNWCNAGRKVDNPGEPEEGVERG